jgi:mRNA interferase MazF
MRRGDIYVVDLDPARNSAASRVRPAVVVSNDAANRAAQRSGRGVVTVIPISSRIGQIHPFQVRLPAAECGLAVDSKAHADQVQSVSAARLRWRVGTVPAELLRRLDDALRIHVGL